MSSFPESALITAGFLRERCAELMELSCPTCGSRFHDSSNTDFTNGHPCPVCNELVFQPLTKCTRCKERLASLAAGERPCLSVQAYRACVGVIAFAPEETIWSFKRTESSAIEVSTESELRSRFSNGELDASVLVWAANRADFVAAGICPEYQDAARTRPSPATTPPVVGVRSAPRLPRRSRGSPTSVSTESPLITLAESFRRVGSELKATLLPGLGIWWGRVLRNSRWLLPFRHNSVLMRRVVAIAVDGAILGALLGLTQDKYQEGANVGVFHCGMLCYAYMEKRFGRTPGKYLTGIRVYRDDGSKLTLLRAVARVYCKLLSLGCWVIPFFTMVGGREAAILHDSICKTTVRRVL